MKTRRRERRRIRLNPRKMQQRRYRRHHSRHRRQEIHPPVRRRGNEMVMMNVISTTTAPRALPRARDNIDRHLQRLPHGRPVIPVSSRVETHITTWGKSKSMANDDLQVSECGTTHILWCTTIFFLFFFALMLLCTNINPNNDGRFRMWTMYCDDGNASASYIHSLFRALPLPVL